jgi:hypothetical protein
MRKKTTQNESKQLKIYLQVTGNEKRQMVVMRGKYEQK